ncbi:MAG: outer membrane lipoprotein-sorting protein [Bacteroidales bacterium]|jgi:outer membrane lipoprotein-sorting protein|nr:outer membrane lipoprotein-sorting protein [Bacteroidales bacterium]MDD2264886.1 outer membrane lipoprotein-sorting protein [Bacteroidales bacterium]MDD2831962.1 outer membrane lipoprotein-sorting protein [Bacteroidales bacterium]MDD4473573.1 outer membrane lipoprotein-sorting protein [Bacteroidales bacterium]MDD5047108.1 outer membrane lipoprotein-sorting protein [Bacteroidales bacterium]
MKKITLTAVILFISGISNVASSQTPTAKEVQHKSIEVTRVTGTEAISTLIIIGKNGEKRVRKMSMLSKLYDNGLTEKKMVKFTEPADVKGTGFLSYDYHDKPDDKWIFMPALRKTRRIISSENAKSFMGSEFSYADMALPTVEDFNYKFLTEETVNGEACYVLEIIPKNKDSEEENGFSKKISYIGKKDFVIRKAVYFNLTGEKEKVMTVKSITEVDTKNHRYKLKEIEMINLLNNRKSISTIEQIKFNPHIPDDYFTTRYVEK